MGQSRIASRRSFLAQVAGAALVLVAAASPADARRRRRMVVDADPSDPARPLTTPSRPRVSVSPPPPIPRTTDSDAGRYADPGGSGRPAPSRFVICPGNRRCPGRNR